MCEVLTSIKILIIVELIWLDSLSYKFWIISGKKMSIRGRWLLIQKYSVNV